MSIRRSTSGQSFSTSVEDRPTSAASENFSPIDSSRPKINDSGYSSMSSPTCTPHLASGRGSSSSISPTSFSPSGHLHAIAKATFETYCENYRRANRAVRVTAEYPQDNGVYVRKNSVFKYDQKSYFQSGIITSASSEDCRTVIEGDFNSTEDRCNGRYLVWNNCYSAEPCLVIQGELKRINELGHWAAINGFEYDPRSNSLTRVIEEQKFLLRLDNKIKSSKYPVICFYDELYDYFVASIDLVISDGYPRSEANASKVYEDFWLNDDLSDVVIGDENPPEDLIGYWDDSIYIPSEWTDTSSEWTEEEICQILGDDLMGRIKESFETTER